MEKKVKKEKAKEPWIKAVKSWIIYAVIITVFVTVFMHDTTISDDLGADNGKYVTVLANIDGIVDANPRLVDIAMLASHDSVTAGLEPDAPVDYYDRGQIVGKVAPLTRGLQYRFAKTQSVGLDVQLRQGARLFHIKYTDFEGEWYATHTLLSKKVETYILQVLEYLATPEAKGEIVLLLLHPIYFGEGVTLDTFHNWLADVKLDGKNIYDYVNYGATNTFDKDGAEGVRIGDLRYNDLTENGTKAGVVLFDRRESKLWSEDMEGTATDQYMSKFFDMDSNATHKWHSRNGYNTMTKLIDEQATIIAESDEWDNKLRMNQAQPAFSVGGISDLFVDLFSWNLKNHSIRYNAKIIDHEDFDKWLSIMPVFQVDFVNSEYGDFNNKVNAKITAYNQKLVADLLSA
ncbi:MAG: hypothetical protein J6R34_00085 [Clostridia bacterium]|nr:hypothetical protein [Clostridia bacterium]MBO5776828.1 hypothetical protein [Clostridia bacterium]